MATVKITEKELVSAVKQEASFLITQKEMVNGSETEALRRAEMAVIVAALQAAGINKDLLSKAAFDKLQPEIIKSIEPTEEGLLITYLDNSSETLSISTGGLAFDAINYDQETGYLHITMNGEEDRKSVV